MPEPSSVTLAVLAAHCGVAKSTVSRVLNHYTEGFSVRPEVRERILTTAKRLNYHPHPLVRSLRAKRTGLIALLGLNSWTLAAPGVTGLLMGDLVRGLHEAGFNVCTNFLNPAHDPFAPPRWRIDGAAMAGVPDASQLRALEASGVPYVSINGACGANGSSVLVDDVDGTRQIMRHLIGLGHRRIAYANLRRNQAETHSSVADRHATYLAELANAGLAALPGHDRHGRDDDDIVAEAIGVHRATAILAYDHNRVGLVRACLACGRAVPGEVSIACFNDDPLVEVLNPAMTVVALPLAEMGSAAAGMLLRRVAGGMPEHVTMRMRLVVRGTTAAPR